ncbi:MAG: hypothetical protein QGG48_13995, partial [Desulfatiglandales bacterium]|nr:hypothetical protein [Desulfatiglandales bacterium]
WIGSVLVPRVVIWEAWRLHFNTLGDRLGDPGVLGDTPEVTWESRFGFSLILNGFWDSLGTNFGVILVTFS